MMYKVIKTDEFGEKIIEPRDKKNDLIRSVWLVGLIILSGSTLFVL